MALRLPRKPDNVAIVTKEGYPTKAEQLWWQRSVEAIERAFSDNEAVVDDLSDAVAAIAAAQAAAEAADNKAEAAQADADTANSAIAALEILPSIIRTVTTSGSAQPSDAAILVNAASGPVTITLVLAVVAEGPVTIKKIDTSGNAVTIAADTGDQINGGASISITTAYEAKTCYTDGSDWFA